MSAYQKHLLPVTILLLLGFIWGTGYSIARYAITHGVNPLGYSFWQSVGPAVLMSVLAFVFSLREADETASKIYFAHHWRYYFIAGLTGIALPNTNMYFAAAHLPAGLLAVTVNTVPIFVYLMALSAHLERFRMIRFIAVIFALIGLILIALPDHVMQTKITSTVLLALITPLSFAFSSVYITRFRPNNISSLNLAAGTLIASSILLIPVMYFTQTFYIPHLPPTASDAVILLEIILSSLGYVLFFTLLALSGPVYYSFVDTIVAITGLFWGWLLFKEHFSLQIGVAIFFILIALILINRNKS